MKFYSAYRNKSSVYNYVDISMRVDFLSQSLKIKEK